MLARLLAVFGLSVVGIGCAAAPAGPLWADPGVVRLDPGRTEVDIEIHNISGTARPIGEFQFGGEDWGSLRFVDDSLPRTIARNGSVVVRLAISPASFRREPGVYRSGHATLRFRSDRHQFEVPIEFIGTAEERSGAPPIWLAGLILALLGGAGLLGLLGLLTPGRAHRAPAWVSTTSARLGVAWALAALLLLAALIPFGPGHCVGRLGARVGPAELEQCRAGLGGFELTLLPASPGVWWWVIALAIAAAAMAVVRVRANQTEDADEHATGALVALSLIRVLGFALILAALLVGLVPDSLSASDLVLAQLRSGTELLPIALPAWGILAQPLACAAAFALAISLPLHQDSDPALAILTRFERLLWSALLTTTFLGGWSIPGLSERAVPLLSQAGTLTAELLAFALKLALVDLVLTRLATTLQSREVDASTLLRAHARWTLPLAFLNLIAVSLWRLLI